MFPEMRRSRQQLTREEAEDILRSGTSGVLALSGAGDYPYALPISYVYSGGRLYFHCAAAGHKLELIAKDPRASFCVTAMDEVLPEKFTTCYRSAIAFGFIRVLEDRQEMLAALDALGRKYAPGLDPAAEISSGIEHVRVLEMSVDHLTGKESRELLQRREAENK